MHTSVHLCRITKAHKTNSCIPGETLCFRAFHYSRTTNMFNLDSTISGGLQGPRGNNGAVLAVSSNSSDSTAILWASYAANGDANQSVRPGILRAIDASDVTKELWNSMRMQMTFPATMQIQLSNYRQREAYLATFSKPAGCLWIKE